MNALQVDLPLYTLILIVFMTLMSKLLLTRLLRSKSSNPPLVFYLSYYSVISSSTQLYAEHGEYVPLEHEDIINVRVIPSTIST